MYLQEPKVDFVPLVSMNITATSWCDWNAEVDKQAGYEECVGVAPMNNCDKYHYPSMFTSEGGCYDSGVITAALT